MWLIWDIQESEMEMLNKMAMYKQLFSDGGQQSNPMKQMKELFELQTLMGGQMGLPAPKEEEESFSDIFKMAAPLFAQAQQAQAPVPEPTPQPNPIDKEKQRMNFMIKMGINQLLKAATKGKAHELQAEFLIDTLGEERARQLITAPDAIEKLIAINPKVNDFKVWFMLLGEHIKAQLGMESSVSSLYVDEQDLTGAEDGVTVEGNSSPDLPPNEADIPTT